MKRSLLSLLLLGQVSQGAFAEPPPDWAKDAVDTVETQGIMKGYPDGSQGGEKPVTRNEYAEMMERLDQKATTDQSEFAPKSELDATRTETSSVVEQMDALDKRVENLEQNEGQLEERRDEVRRPGF